MREYKGFKIELDCDMQFMVTDPNDKDYRDTFTSYEQATKAIDNMCNVRRQEKRKQTSFAVIVSANRWDNTLLKRMNICGIHARTGAILFTDKSVDTDRCDIYPAADWIEKLLLKKQELEDEVEKIKKQLAKVEIEQRPYGGYGQVDDYDEAIKSLEYEWKKKTKAAERAAK